MVLGSNPGRENYILYEIYRPALGQVSNRGLFSWGQSDRSVRMAIHLHLLPKLRMSGAIPPSFHITSYLEQGQILGYMNMEF